jgi:hypothetical protein
MQIFYLHTYTSMWTFEKDFIYGLRQERVHQIGMGLKESFPKSIFGFMLTCLLSRKTIRLVVYVSEVFFLKMSGRRITTSLYSLAEKIVFLCVEF